MDNNVSGPIPLAGFLFGNIDESGQLDTDLFDNDTKKYLGSLTRLGFGSFVDEIIGSERITDNSERKSSLSGSDSDEYNESQNSKPTPDGVTNDDFTCEKDPTAVDYGDINELADDCQAQDSKPESDELQKLNEDNTDYDADDEEAAASTLMPPPPEPKEGDSKTGNKDRRRIDTPLAAMLPSKYADVDVTEIFPDFRYDKVLRFSRLFGPGKPSSLPQIWRSVRKRRKRKKLQEHTSDSGSDQENVKEQSRGWFLNYAPEPTKEMCLSDNEDKLLRQVEDKSVNAKVENNDVSDSGPRVADWRFGPAQVWYDMLQVSETGDGFNYGFKLKDNTEEVKNEDLKDVFPDDAFLLVSQLHWEDDVVWNGEDIKYKVMQKLNCKTNAAGWVPSSSNRTAQAFSQPGKGITNVPTAGIRTINTQSSQSVSVANKHLQKTPATLNRNQQQNQAQDNTDDTWYSIFPVENEELVYGRWEDEVIWDAENMDSIPKPKILTLDPNDENIILGIPNDVDPAKQRMDSRTPVKVKIPHPHVKKSKILLGKAGVINVMEQDSPPPPPKSPNRDPFNISNDSYYMPKTSESSIRLKVGGNLLQHSTPVVELRVPFVQTHMGPMRLRNFHRPPLKRFSHGALSQPGPHQQRDQERAAAGGGDIFFMRTPEDLSGKDGEIVLIEFCEEHPPLINQVGMCSKIKNYYKRKAGKDQGPPEYKYGETAYAHTSPFLGIMAPGASIQTVENNMYRAPLFEHKLQDTDFLVIRTRWQYWIREINALFVAGQECPLYEVPGPNSKRANNFVRDFLQVFIYRLFWKSKDTPRRIRMDDIKKAFPTHSESSIRKRLKLCADFKRTGTDSNWWVIKPDFRLPTEEEIRAMVSPEQCCAYFSMIAAEQRLKDAGYGEKFIFAPQDDDDEEMQLKMDDEVKVAPWNTTRAYIQAIKGKCLLQLTGPADPTGCGEGFSYVRVPNKPTQSKEEQEAQPKRIVTGTDADLRRLSLNNAKALLRKFGVPEEEIKKLSRWEVIDVVRTLSTEKAKAGEEGMTKFSRGNRFSIAEHQERYKEECQRIFELQNRVLVSSEVLSTDEAESSLDEDSSDIEEMGKNLENMLANKKTSSQLSREREEQERQELRKIFMGEGSEEQRKQKKEKKDEDNQEGSYSGQSVGKVLKIYRTFRDTEGKEFTRVEIVRKPMVMDAYLKIRTTKDEAFIKQFATLDEAQKEEMKREKRRIQEQLRRIKRNQERERLYGTGRPQMFGLGNRQTGSPSSVSSSPGGSTLSPLIQNALNKHKLHTKHHHHHKKQKLKELKEGKLEKRGRKMKMKIDSKMKCGSCGNVGHMRTNKACPNYSSLMPTPCLNVAMTEEQEEFEKQLLNAEDDEDLVNVDGTKVKLSGKLLKHAEEIKRKTLLLRVPREAVHSRKRRKTANESHCDYLKRQQRPANRRRTDPVVVLSTILESILNEMRGLQDVQPFLFPVNAKVVPDYYKIVGRPMDLQTIRENLRQKKYQSREEFLADVNQIVENSTLYNGAKSALTVAARRMLSLCVDRLDEKEDKLMRLEKAINPLLDDNDQVALTFILDNVVNNKLKTMQESWPFLKPVNKKNVKDYYNIIKYPMDLGTIAKKVSSHKYHNRKEFLADIELILDNCIAYNGKESPYTLKAEALVKACKSTLEEYDDHLTQLEKNISLVQERALEQAETDSIGTWMAGDDQEYAGSGNNSPMQMMNEGDFVDVEGVSGDAQGRDKTHVLEEDLQFSSEEEFDDMRDDSELKWKRDDNPQDDSQQAAMAMMELGGGGYFSTQEQVTDVKEESMDVDPNYDPSDFLMAGLPPRNVKPEDEQNEEKQLESSFEVSADEKSQVEKINADLEVSDSDEENRDSSKMTEQPQEDDGEDDNYRAAELNYHGPTVRGWRSAFNCTFPQEIVLRLEVLAVLHQSFKMGIRAIDLKEMNSTNLFVQLTAQKIEIYTNQRSDAEILPSNSSPDQFNYLGFITFSDNKATGFRSRELKSILIPSEKAKYIKLKIYNNHINNKNVFNQVGLIGINILGNEIGEKNQEHEFNNNAYRPTTLIPSNTICNSRYTSPYDDLAFEMYVDEKTATIIRSLEWKKQQAILEEDFEQANLLKLTLEDLRAAGEILGLYEQEKKRAIQEEDFDQAKLKKLQIENFRQNVYTVLNVDYLLQSFDFLLSYGLKEQKNPYKLEITRSG
ncbi:hypothetical protein RUM43_002542 [Polyplax serrata]|uniref:Transcription initiation factor TFIID subunit 1 n=1 Tax=Polyplax serrata TaxID=468196 RepID=A0AAN8NZB6_POLSC